MKIKNSTIQFNIKLAIIFLFLISFSEKNIKAQERIDTDRPDQTESANLTPKGFFQSEIGFNIEKDKGLRTFVHPTALWKYGLNRRIEFRLITEFISDESPFYTPPSKSYNSGLLPVQLGSRIALFEEKGILPKTSLIFHVGIPGLSSAKFKTRYVVPNFRFSMAHSLSETIGLGYNIGAEWDGFDKTPEWIYTFAPGFNIGKNWYGYVELFGAIKKNEAAQHSFDAGMAYFISNSTKIDLSAGVGISDSAPDNYISLGFSFWLNTKK